MGYLRDGMSGTEAAVAVGVLWAAIALGVATCAMLSFGWRVLIMTMIGVGLMAGLVLLMYLAENDWETQEDDG